MAASSPSSKNLSFSSCPQVSSRLTNTSARNSEASDPMRRSFSGTPFAKPSIVAGHKGGCFNSNTPANSPSDCTRRHSIGRENTIVSLQDHDDKENGKDHNWKSAKGRSQASVKGSKNFMSPTISAASKINASPRKKVLTERNDYIRSSVSSFDGKCPSTEELDAKTEKGLNQKKEVSFDSTITYLGEGEASIEDKMAVKDIDLMSQTNAEDDLCLFSGDLPVENDCVNLDPSFIISPGVSCSSPMPALAPLDADPIAPPYDPKTNYLSPRPQFRHYKPNQRIDMYLNKETDSKRLEQSFLSDCLSDTETTEEETDSDVSQKESEDLYSDETSKEKEKEEELPVSGFISISPEGAAVAAKRLSKPQFFKTKKFFALISVLAIACILMSLTNSPIIDSSLLNNLDCSELYVPHEISEFTRKSLDDIAERFKLQLSNLLSYGHKMISSFKDDDLGALQYANLTSLLKDGLNHGYLTFDHGFIGAKIKDDKNVFGHRQDIEPLEDDIEMIEGDDDQGSEEHEDTESTIPDEDIEEVLGGDYQGFEEHEDTESTIPDDIEEVLGGEEQLRSGAEDNSEVSVEWNIPETENLNMASQDGMVSPGNSVRVVTEGRSNVELRSAVLQDIITVTQLNENPATEVTEDRIEAAYTFELSSTVLKDVKPEMLDARQAQGENVMNSAQLESILAEEIPKSRQLADTSLSKQRNSESLDFALNRYIFSPKIIAAISLLAWSLATAATIIYLKNRRPATNTDAASVMLPSLSKKLNQSPLLATSEHIMQDMEEVDVVGESCPSEMSSFRSSSYYKKKELAGTTEALSHERKPRKHNSRRESLASSDYSTGSPSYGSFTSYEKVPIKHGNKEEAITPVRRSSRIRGQVTST